MSGEITHIITTVRKGFMFIALNLYESPVPKTLDVRVIVLDSGSPTKVAPSTRMEETRSDTSALLSLIMALVGASAGISLRVGFHENVGLLHLIILTWVLAPVLSIIAAFYLNRLLVRDSGVLVKAAIPNTIAAITKASVMNTSLLGSIPAAEPRRLSP